MKTAYSIACRLGRHHWNTIRFQHLTHRATGEWGVWAVNRCVHCGATHPFAYWQGDAKARDRRAVS